MSNCGSKLVAPAICVSDQRQYLSVLFVSICFCKY